MTMMMKMFRLGAASLKKHSSLGKVILFLSLLVLVFLMVLVASFRFRRPTLEAIAARTAVEIQALGFASQQFNKSENRWPTNLAELQTNKSGLIYYDGPLKDYWNHPFHFTPPTENSPGIIESYGADGNPTGDKSDGDASFQFQVDPNVPPQSSP